MHGPSEWVRGKTGTLATGWHAHRQNASAAAKLPNKRGEMALLQGLESGAHLTGGVGVAMVFGRSDAGRERLSSLIRPA